MANPILYDFDVPEALRADRKLRGVTLPKKITMRELGANDELQVATVAKSNYQKSRYDAAKRAIAELDGVVVNYADETIDQFWENCGAVMRELVLEAYEAYSAPSAEVKDGFLASRKDRLA
jgi:hypothetical protein